MRRWLNAIILASFSLLLLVGCELLPFSDSHDEPAVIDASDPFVSVRGTQFFRHGKPYNFVGTNLWYGAYLGASVEGQSRLIRELDLLRNVGISNLRVLAVSEQTDLVRAVRPGIQMAPGKLSEEYLIGLDFLLSEMAKRDMQAVLYFTNYWQWSGGMAQYMAWETGEPAFDPDETGDWNGFMQNSAKFYFSESAQDAYRSVIKQIILRENTLSGVAYVNDPAIMAWQLANEPRPGSDSKGRDNFSRYKNWIDETAGFIKSLDSRHLVSSGSEGAMGSLQEIDLYKDSHATGNIDYLTFHLWPKNWFWLDIQKPDETYSLAVAKAKAYILQHIGIAQQLGKPTVLEEFGIERDDGAFATSTPTTIRDQFYNEIFSLIETQAKLKAPLAGSNFWAWGGFGAASHNDFMWRTGDDYVGDPPQEAQGLNSVFASDSSTLDLIHSHSKQLSGR